MYHKGIIQIEEVSYDANEDDGYDETYKFYNKKAISLPHSCGEWIIGGKEEALQMIDDLNEAIKNLTK